MLIKDANLNDIAAIEMLCAAMAKETNFKNLRFDHRKAFDSLNAMIRSGYFVKVAILNDKIVGGMIGYLSTPWYSNDLIAYDIGLFVEENARGGRLAMMLVKAFTEWAKNEGATQIRPGISSGVIAAGKIYERLGYIATGNNYLLEV